MCIKFNDNLLKVANSQPSMNVYLMVAQQEKTGNDQSQLTLSPSLSVQNVEALHPAVVWIFQSGGSTKIVVRLTLLCLHRHVVSVAEK